MGVCDTHCADKRVSGKGITITKLHAARYSKFYLVANATMPAAAQREITLGRPFPETDSIHCARTQLPRLVERCQECRSNLSRSGQHQINGDNGFTSSGLPPLMGVFGANGSNIHNSRNTPVKSCISTRAGI